MAEDQDDRQESIDAEMKLRFVLDSARLIDQMGVETQKLSQPLRERRIHNHFFDEYNELYAKKRARR